MLLFLKMVAGVQYLQLNSANPGLQLGDFEALMVAKVVLSKFNRRAQFTISGHL